MSSLATQTGRLVRTGVAALAAAALAIGLSGCTGPADAGSSPGGSATGGTPPATTAAPAPTTPVPAPGSGNITEVVTPSATPTAITTGLREPASPAEGITVRVSRVEAIKAKSQGPGEVSGPAVAVTVTIENGTDKPFDTALFTINLEDAKGLPGAGMIGPPADWFSGPVAAGEKASGVYVFRVPKANRKPVKVFVSADPGLPTVTFSGNA